MTHEEILYLIICLILSCVSFIGGWFAAKYHSLKGRLASNYDLHTDDGSRAAEAAERTQDLIGATESISSIIKRYEDSASKDTKLE